MRKSQEVDKTMFVTGGSGFLGWHLIKYLRNIYKVYASYYHHPFQIEKCTTLKLNICERTAVREALEIIRPDVIFHTAALAKVDTCEKNKELAYQINVEGTKNLVVEAPRNCRFIYISTDLVFDGERSFYQESDTLNPINFYGETKVLGEAVIAENTLDYLIIRTSLMYGYGNGFSENFLDGLRKTLSQGTKARLFIDQYRTPLLVFDAAKALTEISTAPVQGEIFHLGGSERINRYEFGRRFAHALGYPEDLLEPAPMEKVLTVKMPRDCSLCIDKIQNFLSFSLSNGEDGIKALLLSN